MALEARLLPPAAGAYSESLWQKALNRLDDDTKKNLDYEDSDKRSIVAKVLRAAEEKKQLCMQKGWRFKRANGNDIIIRDLVEKIINWVNTFKTIGDMAMQFDPGHASLPWAGVRFLLQVAVNDTQIFGATIESLETISRLITRYAIFEQLYLQRVSAARGQLLEALALLYAEILTVLANATKYFGTSTLVRTVKSLALSPSDSYSREIAAKESTISDLARLFDAEMAQVTDQNVEAIRGLLENLEKPIIRLADHSTMSLRSLESGKFLALLRWLSPVPFSRHHECNSEIRLETTGDWLLGHPSYLGWNRSSSSSLLLLHGVQGSGKTILASAVIDSFLQKTIGETHHAQVAYFYCAKNGFEAERSDPDDILRSLVRQLTFSTETQRVVHESLVIEYDRREAEAQLDGFDTPRLRSAECINLILDLAALNPLVLIIDAIDEVRNSRRHELIDGMNAIISRAGNVVKIFLTTRNDSQIFALLPETQSLCIHESDNARDVEKFVRRTVAHAVQTRRLLNGNVTESFQEDIIQLLIKGAREMFLWVILQIENLCHMRHETDIRQSAQVLPERTLEQLYTGTFEMISNPYTSAYMIAKQAFAWLLCTQEALSPAALLAAISGSHQDRRKELDLSSLLNICANLIILDSKLNVMRFAHTSILEFLESKIEFASPRLHALAAKSCLNMCTSGTPASVELGLHPTEFFYDYALLYWAEHCRLASTLEVDEELSQQVNDFVFEHNEIGLAFTTWMEQIQVFSKTMPNDHPLKKVIGSVLSSENTPLFVACAFGLQGLLERISVIRHTDWNSRNDHGQTGLYIAAALGNEKVVRFLVRKGADVHARGGKFVTPLQTACFSGHISIVEILISAGADPGVGGAFEDALQASLLGDQKDIALFLLGTDFNIRSQESFNVIFHQATEAGFADVVAKLSTKYALSYSTPTMNHSKLIEAAIKKGQVGILERYVRRGSTSRSDFPVDGVSMAAFAGHEAMINFLLEQGQDIEQSGPFGSPLRVASLMGHESTLRLLLERGANVDACDIWGSSLQAAALKGHLSITRMFSNLGANVNLQGGYHGNALQAACYRGHLEVVQALLDAGASIQTKGISSDAVHAAVDAGHHRIVNLFLTRGYKFSESSSDFMGERLSAMNIKDLVRDTSPTRSRNTTIITGRQILDQKFVKEKDVARDPSFEHLFSKFRHTAAGNEPKTQEYQYLEIENLPLHVAAAKGYAFAVKVFLENFGGYSGSALIGSSKNEHHSSVGNLIGNKTDVKDIERAIKAAAFHGHLDVVETLLEFDQSNQSPKSGNWTSHIVPEGIAASGMISNGAVSQSYLQRMEMILRASCSGKQPRVVTWVLENLSQCCQIVQCSASITEALLEAVKEDSYEVVSVLLSHNNSVLEDTTIARAFDSACQLGCQSVLPSLIGIDKFKAVEHFSYQKGLEKAANRNLGNIIDVLLTSCPNVQDLHVSEDLFLTACGNGYIDIVRSLHGAFGEVLRSQNLIDRGLHTSCQYGHNEVVAFLLRKNADVMAVADEIYDEYSSIFKNTRKPRQNALETALLGCRRFQTPDFSSILAPQRWHKAGRTAQETTIQLLIDKIASISAVDSLLQFPLRMIVELGTPNIIKSLISKDSLVDASSSLSKDLLIAAAGREAEAGTIFNILLEAGANIPENANDHRRILDIALSSLLPREGTGFHGLQTVHDVLSDGPGTVIKLMLSRLPDIKADSPSFGQLLQMAAVIGDAECTKLILDHGFDVNATGFYYGTTLQAASRHGRVNIVELLLSSGADVNAFGGAHGTALHAAVRSGDTAIVQRLLEANASVSILQEEDNAYSTALRNAVEGNHSTIAKMLIQHDADPISRISSSSELKFRREPLPLLHQAVKNKNDVILASLLAVGTNANICAGKQKYRWCISDTEATPLHMACDQGFIQGVQTLLKHRVKIDIDIEQQFELSWLKSKAKRADLKKRVAYVKRPLQVAAYGGNVAIVKLLIKAGANVSYHDPITGHTALSMASSRGHLEIAEDLVEAGAPIYGSIRMANSLVAACRGRHRHVIEYLLEELSGTDVEECACAEAMYAMDDSEYDDMTQLLLERGVSRPLEPCPEEITTRLEASAITPLCYGDLSAKEKNDDDDCYLKEKGD
ncbi:MAG: hypothetical protein Q9195_006603 [Heterodermia aff. obscurata]